MTKDSDDSSDDSSDDDSDDSSDDSSDGDETDSRCFSFSFGTIKKRDIDILFLVLS